MNAARTSDSFGPNWSQGGSVGKRRAKKLIGDYWLDQKRGRRSGIWCAAWYDPQAKTVRYKSLATRDEQEAEQRLLAMVAGQVTVHRLPPAQAPTLVYFIRGDVGGIKIGASHDPQGRLVDFQRCSPIPIALVATAPGGYDLEREYHKRFAAHRLHGEWFAPHPDILAEIERLVGAA